MKNCFKIIFAIILSALCIVLFCSCSANSEVKGGSKTSSVKSAASASVNADEKTSTAKTTDDNATFDIKTSVTVLKYPARYKDKVTIKVSNDKVEFYAKKGNTHLFDLVFKKCDGYLLGTYKRTPIYIVDYKTKTPEEADMTEAVNVIFDNLKTDKNFSYNTE